MGRQQELILSTRVNHRPRRHHRRVRQIQAHASSWRTVVPIACTTSDTAETSFAVRIPDYKCQCTANALQEHCANVNLADRPRVSRNTQLQRQLRAAAPAQPQARTASCYAGCYVQLLGGPPGKRNRSRLAILATVTVQRLKTASKRIKALRSLQYIGCSRLSCGSQVICHEPRS